MNKWKAVATEPPTENGSYIICTELGKVCTAHFYTGTGRFSGYAGRHAAYWQELPKPPASVKRIADITKAYPECLRKLPKAQKQVYQEGEWLSE